MILFILVTIATALPAVRGDDAFNPIPVVPYPQFAKMLSTDRIGINSARFRISPPDELKHDDIMVSAAIRYNNYFSRFQGRSHEDGIDTVKITVHDPTAEQEISGTNESYSLMITPPSTVVTLNAATRVGVLRGLETLYQLYNVTDGKFPAVNIEDSPRFAFRGLMIDTSRHFLDLELIFKVIEAMSMNKLNILHWHIVDDPSFPYESYSFPDLAAKGAYDQDHMYSQADIAKVIEYARIHGVVVLPEFDTPGHTLSWGKGAPGLLAHCPGRGTFGSDYGPIDPTVDNNYKFLERLMSEVAAVFGTGYFHLGGDEVSFYCWAGNPNITDYMKKHNITDHTALESYYEEKLLNIVEGLGQSYIVWEEVFNNGLKIKPDTIIHVWKGKWQNTLSKAVKAGYRTILSSPWYLNYISFGRDWKNYYSVEPYSIDATPEELKMIQGGEACVWGEFVDNTNVLSRTFPRASAVAERLWSSKGQVDIADAEFRLDKHRCGMCARGIPAETVLTRGFCSIEYEMF